MAYTIAALIQAVTATTGTNNYVLSDPASPGPLRTDVQAVADGSLANGQTIHYMVRDTTVLGDASFEEGIGVYTSATRTVARTAGNVIDGSSGPGVLVSWGSSGQRDFYVLRALDGEDVRSAAAFATNLGLPRLSAANVFTTDQAIARTDTLPASIAVGSKAKAVSAVVGAIELRGEDAAGNAQIYGLMRADIADPTNGSEDGDLKFSTVVAGTLAVRAQIVGGVIQTAAGVPYDAFPAGTKMLFAGAPPAGWTRVNETNQAIIRLATAADTPNASGGSDTFFDGAWATDGHTLTESQIPAHTHNVNTKSGAGPSTVVANDVGTGGTVVNVAAQSTGGGGAHAHNMTTPFYRIACWATKN